MARAKRWSITFNALGGTTYTAYIYDEDWTGSVTALTPAANPFETQESNSDDAFEPVRTSTGYIRFIVQNLSIIDTFMCQRVDGRYIELVQGNTVKWHGYVQAQTFTCPWDSAPYEIEFPIVSALGLLDNMPYTPGYEFYTIGYIIKKALTNNGNIDFTTWHTPTRNQVLDFSARINDRVFRNENVEEWVQHVGQNANISFPPDKLSCLSVIEDICRFFGWSLYERGKDLFFVSIAGTQYYQYGLFASIDDEDPVSAQGNETATSSNLPQVLSDSNTRRFLKGYSYFEIKEDVIKPADPVDFDITKATPQSRELKQSSAVSCMYIHYGTVFTPFVAASESATGDVLASGSYYGCYLVRIKTNDDWLGLGVYIDSRERNEYKPALVIRNGVQERFAMFQAIHRAVGRTFPGGIALSANVNYWNETAEEWGEAPANSKIKMKIRWGDKYLGRDNSTPSGWGWLDTDTSFNTHITNGKLHGGAIVAFNEPGYFPIITQPQDMFYIPVDNSLSGILRVYIYSDAVSEVSDARIVLSDIKMQAFRVNETLIDENIDYETNLFRMVGDMDGKDVLSKSSRLCSAVSDVQASDMIVLQNSLTDALATMPETDTLTRISNMYGSLTEQIEVDVRGTAFIPYNKIIYQSATYCVVSVQTSWNDNMTRLKLQKIS